MADRLELDDYRTLKAVAHKFEYRFRRQARQSLTLPEDMGPHPVQLTENLANYIEWLGELQDMCDRMIRLYEMDEERHRRMDERRDDHWWDDDDGD